MRWLVKGPLLLDEPCAAAAAAVEAAVEAAAAVGAAAAVAAVGWVQEVNLLWGC